MLITDDHKTRRHRNHDYCEFLSQCVIDFKDRSHFHPGKDSWFAHMGPCLAMVEEYQHGTGCCFMRVRLWHIAYQGEEEFVGIPCLDVEWSDQFMGVDAFLPGDWEREFLAFLSGTKRFFPSAPLQVDTQDLYYR
jgi:hypothetical protein